MTEAKWEKTALNPNLPVYRMSNGRLVQHGKPMRVRAAHRSWGFCDILTLKIYDPDGKALVATEVTTPAKFNAMRLPRIEIMASEEVRS